MKRETWWPSVTLTERQWEKLLGWARERAEGGYQVKANQSIRGLIERIEEQLVERKAKREAVLAALRLDEECRVAERQADERWRGFPEF